MKKPEEIPGRPDILPALFKFGSQENPSDRLYSSFSLWSGMIDSYPIENKYKIPELLSKQELPSATTFMFSEVRNTGIQIPHGFFYRG